MARHDGHAVFLARFLPVLRTLTPHLAGAARLPYRRIAPYSAVAAPLWATAEAGTGYAAAASAQRAVALGAPALAVAVAVVAGAALIWTKIRANAPRQIVVIPTTARTTNRTADLPSDSYATARSSESSNHECASPTVTSSPVMSPTSSQ